LLYLQPTYLPTHQTIFFEILFLAFFGVKKHANILVKKNDQAVYGSASSIEFLGCFLAGGGFKNNIKRVYKKSMSKSFYKKIGNKPNAEREIIKSTQPTHTAALAALALAAKLVALLSVPC
jgi:hypothetical protein